ncbi:MAG: hypothetical protein CMI55_00795 [Parcubacteria group bacterium]|jgi:hypothetical protein|nr:hypothetical protein [Parcubacteria group bacterium]|tara:strand:- start:16205 stop:17365 length:1161 start_codon:yes stop_codon:yes gene_type:complete
MKFQKILYLIVTVLLLSFVISGALAAEFRVAQKQGTNITVAKDEKVKNLYTAGNVISIDGDIEKGLRAAGNMVTVNGNVENSVCAAGGTVIIRGAVGDSVHAGAGTVIIESQIQEDVFLGGGNIVISKTASIGGDLFVGGGTVDIQGSVVGDVNIGGGQVIINSKIGGNVKANVDELKLDGQAEIVGDLTYSSSKEALIADQAKVLGEINFKKAELGKTDLIKRPKALIGILSLAFLLKVLMGIATGLVLVYIFRNITDKAVKEALTRFWPNLGAGFSALILTPVAFIILLITVVGIGVASLTIAIYGLLILLSVTLASITFGSWLIKVFGKKSEYSVDWKTVILGVIALKLVILIPLVGWLVGLVFALISLGALVRLFYQAVVRN